jgi:hypothetical protein
VVQGRASAQYQFERSSCHRVGDAAVHTYRVEIAYCSIDIVHISSELLPITPHVIPPTPLPMHTVMRRYWRLN